MKDDVLRMANCYLSYLLRRQRITPTPEAIERKRLAISAKRLKHLFALNQLMTDLNDTTTT